MHSGAARAVRGARCKYQEIILELNSPKITANNKKVMLLFSRFIARSGQSFLDLMLDMVCVFCLSFGVCEKFSFLLASNGARPSRLD